VQIAPHLIRSRYTIHWLWLLALPSILALLMVPRATVMAQDAHFHNAPASSRELQNPYVNQADAVRAGKDLYTANCAKCHGMNGQGTGNVPAINQGPTQTAADGEVFWFITTGSVANGMPSWEKLPQQQRWQLVAYIRSLKSAPETSHYDPPASPEVTKTNAPAPPAPFTDFRYEAPGRSRKITVQDLPAPYASKSSDNGPDLVRRPASAWPKAPAGFSVQQFATGLDNPRLLMTAPNGDIFLAESESGKIRVFRGITADGKAQQMELFAKGLKQPYGIAFYPPGGNPQWVYVGDTDAVLRFPYQNGDLKARGAAQKIADLPHGGDHWTRSIVFSPDGQRMFVGVGSASNVDDPDETPDEKYRADILEFMPDGKMHVFAWGIRNAGGGLAVDPKSGELWCSVNERDGLGDNLVPDYITHVQEGGFYGWPWWYIGSHQDPRHKAKHAELKDKAIVPDVLLEPHNASLEMTFYEGGEFPAEFRGDIFASEHGSWNRSVRVGYEVIRVPMHGGARASGEYEDFLTGFVVDNGHVWGRPVGITVASDGSLLVSDDGSNSIWRVSWAGK
jgi:glucose/arabinose dehydrogenase/mono/diheme cytochrome c family protein